MAVTCMRDSERPILVVEDDEDSREFLATFLRAQGYLVTTAANGEEALTKARQKHPRLILLDLMMPGMDGFAFRAAQLRSPEVANIPVILISGLEDDTQIARRLGPMAEVPKPINIDRLLEQVALSCERVSIPDQRRP